MFKRIKIIGVNFSLAKQSEVIDSLLSSVGKKALGYICVSNVHTTMTAFFDPKYKKVQNDSFLTVPDGVPLVWAIRSMGFKEQNRVRGPSLMKELLDRGRLVGAKHYLYGGTPNSLQDLLHCIERDYPGAKIVGSESPPFRAVESISEEELLEIADRINNAKADFLWVGIGAPKQEVWMWMQRDNITVTMLGIGAAFDLLSNRIPEAPLWMQSMALEWLYRLYKEPRRLWRRYLLNNPLFLFLWVLQYLNRVLFRRSYLCDSRHS
ncbi:MAG: WecB/TagA/CpsF family glycosyltransferase [Oligoflexia bacterium]|nr:WecB/TagA/CpsF family glycosyltransferase [Oligoflexia bacterium]